MAAPVSPYSPFENQFIAHAPCIFNLNGIMFTYLAAVLVSESAHSVGRNEFSNGLLDGHQDYAAPLLAIVDFVKARYAAHCAVVINCAR